MPKIISMILAALGIYVVIGGVAPFFEELQPFERVIVGIIILAIALKLRI